MINFRIVSIPHVAQSLLRTWNPKEWAMVNHDLNPWSDPLIDRLNLLIHNLKRQAYVRSPETRGYYFSIYADLILYQIEAEYEYYFDSTLLYQSILRAYIAETYLPAEIESFLDSPNNGNWVNHTVPDPDEIPTLFDRQAIYRYALDSFEPKTGRFFSALANRIKEREDSLPKRWTRPEHKLNFINPLLSWESIFHDQFTHLLYEFHLAAQNHNALSGASAKSRAFLINGSIPLPNKFTILAWYALCGIDFRILAAERNPPQAEGMAYYLHYSLPSLPMTQEHVLNAPIPGEDSDSSHSLGFKSPAHSRTVYGRIIHGKWEAVSKFLADSSDDSGSESRYLIARQIIQPGKLTKRFLRDQTFRLLPRPPFGDLPKWLLAESGPIGHPDYASYYPVNPNDLTQAWDVGMRALAKWHRIHLRFDDDEIGTLAAEEWRLAFESSILAFTRLKQTEVLAVQFEAALIRQRIQSLSTSETKPKRGRKPMTDFGFTDIWK